jgi:hypothetical protein
MFMASSSPITSLMRRMCDVEFAATRSPNQTMQPTAGRSDAPLNFMKTGPLQATLALPAVADLILVRRK